MRREAIGSEAVAAAAFWGGAGFWLLGLAAAFASGWSWALCAVYGTALVAVGLPFLLVALVQHRGRLARGLLRALLGLVAAVALNVGTVVLLNVLGVF